MQLLPQVSFSILLALSLRPRHGYEIMKQVTEDSIGRIKLGPGSLYAAIKQLKDGGLIEEVSEQAARRRYYRLTDQGRRRLHAELEYFHRTLELGRGRQAYEGFTHA